MIYKNYVYCAAIYQEIKLHVIATFSKLQGQYLVDYN